MPGSRTHHMTLPSHQISWMWRIWIYSHGLPSQNTTFKHTSTTSQGAQKTTTPGQALDTAEKIKIGETCPDHSLGIADITAPGIMTCTEATLDHNKGMGTATIEAAQGNPIQHTKASVHRTHHDMPHQPHCRFIHTPQLIRLSLSGGQWVTFMPSLQIVKI